MDKRGNKAVTPFLIPKLIPNMAESWEISDDFLTYAFTLRDDLMWDDGTPLTSADFKFTFDKMMDPDNEFPYRDNFDFIESYEAPDERTIVVKVEEKFCPALEGVDAVQPLPKHIWENLNWKDPEKNPEKNRLRRPASQFLFMRIQLNSMGSILAQAWKRQ